MTGTQFASEATMTALGDGWGEPLWRFESGELSVDVHALTEEGAREAAATAYDAIHSEGIAA